MSFLRGKYALPLTIVLLLQAAIYYAAASRREVIPDTAPLALFPTAFGGWQMTADYPLSGDTEHVLRADDTLSRDYVNAAQSRQASLWVAYYKTQRYGQTPHSPKACLPGAGWEPIESATIPITVPGRSEPIVANKYLVANGESAEVVAIYWYQTHNRVIAGEYAARFWLVLDSIRYRRSDTSLVRAMVPVKDGDVEGATRTTVSFIQAFFPVLSSQLPI